MRFKRSRCKTIPDVLSPGDCLLRSNRVARHLNCTDRNVRHLFEKAQLQAYVDPARPKLLFFKLSEIEEYVRQNCGRFN
jgi:hypothetical protein